MVQLKHCYQKLLSTANTFLHLASSSKGKVEYILPCKSQKLFFSNLERKSDHIVLTENQLHKIFANSQKCKHHLPFSIYSEPMRKKFTSSNRNVISSFEVRFVISPIPTDWALTYHKKHRANCGWILLHYLYVNEMKCSHL